MVNMMISELLIVLTISQPFQVNYDKNTMEPENFNN